MLDDLHWADAGIALMMRHVARAHSSRYPLAAANDALDDLRHGRDPRPGRPHYLGLVTGGNGAMLGS